MLADVAISTKVPAEFISLARVFRAEVKLVDAVVEEALDLICAPLQARLARHPKLRHEQVAGTGRQYDQLIPSQFRIGPVSAMRHRTTFAIQERRATSSWMQSDEWDADHRELGLTLCTFTLSVHAGRLRRCWTPFVAVSLHALARRIERGRQRSHEALWRDIVALADTGEEGDRVDTTGGAWWGGPIDAGAGDEGRTIRLRSIRTWLPT